ncbi:MAG: formate/nitrite transporter family protein [Firmicutes bacterium]|nr:formate/nitrite transporter family protein [Bacillota bacterium]
MKKAVADFLYAVFAGIMIGIGGTVYLSVQNSVVGALLFAIGLIVILQCGFNLFTGKIGYAVNNKPRYLLFCLLVWAGNLAGTAAVGYALRLTRATAALQRAIELSIVKLNDAPLSILLLSILCGLLMYIAVDGFKRIEHPVGKYITVFLCVSVFILCGFEHCVANMFYFSAANVWSVYTLCYLGIMTVGNALGGVLLPAAEKLKNLLLNKQ